MEGSGGGRKGGSRTYSVVRVITMVVGLLGEFAFVLREMNHLLPESFEQRDTKT